MDSATYGVPNTSPDGYRVHVQLAVRFDNSGNYVHSAPWSVADQGDRNVSHGCINISPADAKWFYDNFGEGDPILVSNSVGSYTQATALKTGSSRRGPFSKSTFHPAQLDTQR